MLEMLVRSNGHHWLRWSEVRFGARGSLIDACAEGVKATVAAGCSVPGLFEAGSGRDDG